ARDGVLRIGELEEAAVLHEAPGRDTRAEDVGPVLRADLQDDVVCERVHPEPGEHGVQVQPGGVARGAQATLLQCERAGLPGARRVLEVGEAVAVAVVVDAVAADLGGRRLRREAPIGVDTHAADAGVRRTGVEVVAVGYRGAGAAAADGGVVADGGIAGVGRAGVVVVAVGERRAAAGDAGVAADAADARLGGAGIVVVTVGGRRAGRAAFDPGVRADANVAGVVGADVVVVAVGGRRAGDAAGAGVIGRTVRTGPRAVLRHVARTGQRTAHGARGEEAVARARVAGPVAGLGDVAHAGRGPAHGPRRALRVGRAARARPRAGLRRIADAGRRPAHRAGGDEGVGRTLAAGAATRLGDVTGARRGAAYRSRVPGDVVAELHTARTAHALVHGTRIAIVAVCVRAAIRGREHAVGRIRVRLLGRVGAHVDQLAGRPDVRGFEAAVHGGVVRDAIGPTAFLRRVTLDAAEGIRPHGDADAAERRARDRLGVRAAGRPAVAAGVAARGAGIVAR